MAKKVSRITFFCKDKNGYHRSINAYPDQDIFSPSLVDIPKDYIIDHIKMGGSDHVWHILERQEKEWLEITKGKEFDDEWETIKDIL